VTALSPEAFEQARRLFIEGNTHFEGARFREALACFEASLQWLPGRPSTLTNLAATLIRLGRHDAALAALRGVLAVEPANADAWCHRGVALSHLGRHDDALAAFDRVLAIEPEHTLALYHRGITLNVQRRHALALPAFERLVQLQPDRAEAWFRHGQTLQALDRHGEALPSYERALALDDTLAQAWSNRGGILKDLKRVDEAAACYERAIELGADVEVNRYFLASLRGQATPSVAPRAYVEGLFDEYADQFDTHLVNVLRYQTPRVLVDNLRRVHPHAFRSALDLGCGTGLCAPLLQPVVRHIDGIDLSQRMLDKARALGLYDRLVKADLVEHLATTERRYDLVLSADVVPYLGDLDALFAAVRSVLDADGMFCFSAERGETDSTFTLRASMRYAHGERYLRELGARHGFAVLEVLQQVLREDQGRPIDGLYLYLHAR
jgi:predicted TPR repeat methyltransferase